MIKKQADVIEQKQPQFNAGIDYLQRLNLLILTFHKNMLVGDLIGAYIALCSFDGELSGRMNNMQEKESQILKKKNEGFISLSENKKFAMLSGNSNLRNLLFEWFKILNKTAHKLGLIMPDKINENIFAGIR